MIPEDAAPEPALAQAASGYRATLVSQAVRLFCKMGGVVVLARLVSPAEHGLFAMAASLTLLLTLFRDFGLGAAAIQSPALGEAQKTALLWLHAGLGVGLAGLTLLLAPAAAAFYHEPRVRPLLFVMSASFVLNGINAWPRTLLHRELQFVALNRVETLGAVIGTAIMIAAGAFGAGAFAFVAFLLASEAVMLAAAWRLCRWRPRQPAQWRGLSALGRTGFNLTGYNFLLYILQQADTLLMGRWFGAAPLGLYNRAGQLLVQPSTHVAVPFSQVLFATLARLGPGSPDFARHFRETTNTILHLTLPLTVTCLVLSHEVVLVVLGSAWPDAAPLLRCLAVSSLTGYLASTIYPLCVTTGGSNRLFHLAALALPVTLVALWLGRSHGPLGLAAALAGANLLLLGPRLWWASRGTPVSLRDFAEAFIGPVGVAGALAVGLRIGQLAAANAGLGLQLLSSGLGGALAVAGCGLVWPRVRQEMQRLWAHRPFAPKAAAVATGPAR